jgi:NitT/TauT family transport system substrate-binding protein
LPLICKTIAIELTFTSLGLLAGLVLIRTFLSWTLVLEIEVRWPWRLSPTWDRLKPGANISSSAVTGNDAPASVQALSGSLIEPETAAPQLGPAGTYVVKDNIVDIELSQYAGYAGFIVANGGQREARIPYSSKNTDLKCISRSPKRKAGPRQTPAAWRLRHHGRRAGSVRPHAPGDGAGADRIFARRRWHRRPQRRAPDQRPQGPRRRHLAVHRGGFFLRYLAQEAGLGVDIMANLAAQSSPSGG